MRIGPIMNRQLTLVTPETSLEELLFRYEHSRSRLLYVVDEEGRLTGIVTTYDLLDALLPHQEPEPRNGASAAPAAETPVADEPPAPPTEAEVEAAMAATMRSHVAGRTADDLMTVQMQGLSPDDLVVEAHAYIREMGVTAVPVLDADGRPVGEVTRHHILACLRRIWGPRSGS